MRKSLVLIICSLFAISCGKSAGLVSPDSPSAKNLRIHVFSARTGQPVPSATMTARSNTNQLVSDANGLFVVSCQGSGNFIFEISAPQFMRRVTEAISCADADKDIYLWPDDSQLPSDYTLNLVYGLEHGVHPLNRPAGPLKVYLDQSILYPNNPDGNRAQSGLTTALSRLNSVAPDKMSFSITNTSTDADVIISMDTAQSFGGALTYLPCDQGCYLGRGSRIVFQSTVGFYGDYIDTVFMHELSHVWGMADSSDPRSWIMNNGTSRHSSVVAYGSKNTFCAFSYDVAGSVRHTEFSTQELESMRYVFLRQPGNLFPDDGSASIK